ncbi:type IV secretory system conjugative DNA transfer family protein [Neisseria sp. Ec49-e6-T10]|uniref:type IV secretory system conjugative DNA transfer family protein n=1 Tax=Neisseria sp. Ec49-e6-T10 TaxID=3140744 RepID=UPI003EB7C713
MSSNKTVKIVFLCICVVLAIIFGLYASSYIFLLLSKIPLRSQTVQLTSFIQWYQDYHNHPKVGPNLPKAALFGFGVPILGLLFLAFKIFKDDKSLYGDARFATMPELKKVGFLKPTETAVIVGRLNNQYLYFSGQQFPLLAAPTRSGKGVGIVIPNLLSYQGSMVVLDIKQENYELTSGFRKKHGQEIYVFNPFAEDRRSHRWNPLTYISDDPDFRVSDLQSIANMLYPVGDDSKDRFWMNQAQNVFLAICLYMLDARASQKASGLPEEFRTPVTLGELYRQSTGDGSKELKEHLQDLASLPFLSPQCKTAFAGVLSQAEETFSNIIATFKEPLLPWLNPITDAATSGDDFLLTDVRKKKMTIYIAIQPNKLAESRLIINLFFSQLINQNTRELPQNNPDLKYQCLLLMDEFTSIGRVDIIAKAVSYMAGYNIRLLPIIQSLAQLDATYGKETSRTLVTNHALQILYTPREQQDANDYSEMLGYTSIKKSSVSRGREVSRTENEERRALMLPQELKAMSADKEIFLFEGLERPVMCDKIRYYKDPAFTQRLLPKASVPILKIKTEE